MTLSAGIRLVAYEILVPLGAENSVSAESEFRFKNGGETQGTAGLAGGGEPGGRGISPAVTTVRVPKLR